MSQAYLGLGGNVGNVFETIVSSLNLLKSYEGCRLVKLSSPYKTLPWGETNQNDFINAVCLVETTKCPHDLLQVCQVIEDKMKRKRTRKWGPRTIDIDILLFEGAESYQSSRLTLPHPYLTERAFVLVPLAELAPHLVVKGMTIEGWCSKVGEAGVKKIPRPQSWLKLNQLLN